MDSKKYKKLLIVIDPDLHQKLKMYSVAKNESMAKIIARLLEKELKNVVIKSNVDA